jgi:type I restriction enzyme S subunit
MGNTLGELCTITKGTTGIQKAISGQYPLVVTAEERKSHNEYQFDDEAVIVPLVSGTGHGHASINRIHYETGKFALGSILCAIIPKDKSVLNAEYLFRFLNLNKDNELVARMRGMANVTLPIKEIAKIEIPLPSLAEQLEFVEKYKLLEEDSYSIELEFQNQLSLVKQLRQAFLSEAMQGKLALTPSHSKSSVETGQQLLERIKAEKAQLIKDKKLKKEKELPPIKPEEIPFEIPKDWVWCRLGEVCYITSGSTPAQSAFVENGVPYLKMYNLKNQKIDFFHKPQYIKEEVHNGQLKRCRAYSGDILMNIVGPPLGKIAIIPNHLPECNFNQAAVLIRPLISTMNLYIFWWLNEMSEINAIDTKGVAGQANISVTQAHNIKVPLPPLSTQNQIVSKLDELMKTCDDLEISIKQSQIQNEQLLQQVLKEALEVKEEIAI